MKKAEVIELTREGVQKLREAMFDGDLEVVEKQRRWLTGQAAMALLNQDAEMLLFLAGRFAVLSDLADQCELPSRPGDSWQMLRDVLFSCAKTSKPLERIRLADVNKLSGRILRHIQDAKGITPKEIIELTGKSDTHISNELKKLNDEGLINRLPYGNTKWILLTKKGRELMEFFRDMENYEPEKVEEDVETADEGVSASTGSGSYPHIETERREQIIFTLHNFTPQS